MRAVLAISIATLLTACGAVPISAPASGTVAFIVEVPQPATTSPDVQSVSITLKNGDAGSSAPIVVALAGPACLLSGWTQTCPEYLTSPSGKNSFAISTFHSADGTGTPICTRVQSTTVLAGSLMLAGRGYRNPVFVRIDPTDRCPSFDRAN